MKIVYVISLLSVVTFLGTATALRPESEHSVWIDTSKELQTFRGWEVSDRLWETNKEADRFDGSWEPLGELLAERLVDDAGIDRLRLQVQSGMENPVDHWARFARGESGYREYKRHYYEAVNDNDDPRVADRAGFQFSALDAKVEALLKPMAARLRARGEKLYVTLNFVDFRWTELKGDLSHAKQPEEYAEFVVETFRHLDTAHGIVPDAVEIILEPDNTHHWSGRRIGAATQALVERLAERGYAPEIIAPSPARAARTTSLFADMGEARALVDMISYHRYEEDAAPFLPDIARTARAFGVETGMLEYTKGTAEDLFEDIIVGGISAWQKYGAARKIENGRPTAGDSYMLEAIFGSAGVEVQVAESTRELAAVFRAIRSGAVRVAARADHEWVTPIAARNPDGSFALALRTTRGGNLVVRGLPGGRYRATATAARGRLASPPSELRVGGDGRARLAVPHAGVVVLRSEAQSGASR